MIALHVLLGGALFLVLRLAWGADATIIGATLLALIVAVDISVDWYREHLERMQGYRDQIKAANRWVEWREMERRRWIDWAFTSWSDPEFSDVHDYRRADRWIPHPSRHRDLPLR